MVGRWYQTYGKNNLFLLRPEKECCYVVCVLYDVFKHHDGMVVWCWYNGAMQMAISPASPPPPIVIVSSKPVFLLSVIVVRM